MRKWLVLFVLFCLLIGPGLSGAAEQAAGQPQILVRGPEGAEQVNYQIMEDGRLMVSVTGADQQPLQGLTTKDFSIRQGDNVAEIVSVNPLDSSRDVGLNIVMVVDNSDSMKQRAAVVPLEKALADFYLTLRPIDTVAAVVFDDRNTVSVNGRPLHARAIKTSDVNQLNAYISEALSEGLTDGTYLYDAVLLGLHLAGQEPVQTSKLLAVFSDGQDINSIVAPEEISQAAQQLDNLSVYAVDYMPGAQMDPFLAGFATGNAGRAWKYTEATAFIPEFESFASATVHRYIVAYRFTGAAISPMASGASELTIEEVTTIDRAPLLSRIYFETGQSALSDRYIQFQKEADIDGFDENQLKGAMEKYRNVLNIIGSRMRAYPDASIRLIGCNADTGIEKGRTDLSQERALAVRSYLQTAWGIDPQRIVIDARDLPEVPTTNRIARGRVENQRVEIVADNADILAPVDSAYVQKVSNLSELRLLPEIQSEAGISNWQMNLLCGDREIRTVKGAGEIPSDWTVPLEAALLEEIAECRTVEMQLQAADDQTNTMSTEQSYTLPVNYVQRTETLGQVPGLKVQEQYAFVLFDYNSADIQGESRLMVERIADRMDQLPGATLTITGHTDDIGSPAYNQQLAERRAQAVKALILSESDISPERLHIQGVGLENPLFDNALPEGRAFNRTVIVNLDYEPR